MLPLRVHSGGVDVDLCLGRIRQRWCQEWMKVCALNPVVAEEWGSPDGLSHDLALSVYLCGGFILVYPVLMKPQSMVWEENVFWSSGRWRSGMGEGSVLGWRCLIVSHVVWYDYTRPSEMGSMVVWWGRSM